MSNCETCKAKQNPVSVPYAVYESAAARAERQVKSLVWVIVLLILLLVGTNVGWLVYESQFEVVEETTTETITYDVLQDGTGENNSVINGGDIVNGAEN